MVASVASTPVSMVVVTTVRPGVFGVGLFATTIRIDAGFSMAHWASLSDASLSERGERVSLLMASRIRFIARDGWSRD